MPDEITLLKTWLITRILNSRAELRKLVNCENYAAAIRVSTMIVEDESVIKKIEQLEAGM